MINKNFFEIVTHPLGLAGFALALVFGVTGLFAHRANRIPGWLPAIAVAMACISVAGGLFLAYKNNPAQAQHDDKNKAETQGSCSAAYAGVSVGGNITVNCDKPTDKAQPNKTK